MHASPIITALVAFLSGCSGEVATDAPATGTEPTGDDTATACAGIDWSGDPTPFVLPQGYPAGAFAEPAVPPADCDDDGAGPPRFDRVDLTGDGRDDLVVTRDCADPDVGDRVWRVYPAQDGGFGDAIDWALPAGFSTLSFTTLEGSAPVCEFGSNVPAWRLRDLDGDGLVDLVTLTECIDPSVGDTTWKVYPNTGSGFGSAVAWPLPTGFSVGAFASPQDEASCEYGENLPAWNVADLDADGRLDLVVTEECVDGEVGDTYWHLWRNEGDRFADAALDWDLPTGVFAPSIERAAASCNYRDYQPAYFLEDMDGDGAPDLVSPFDCIDPAVGDQYWNVYPSTGAGFEDIRIQWRMPDGYATYAFSTGSLDAADCDDGRPAYHLRDVDADGRPDLVVTADCAGSTLGDTHWRVHANEGDRFAAAPAEAMLPLGHSAYAFQPPAPDAAACAGAGDRPAWAIWDVDGDGRDDIVVTEACDDDAVGTSAWEVYPGACAGG